MRELNRRLKIRRAVRLPSVPDGMAPNKWDLGRRRAVTRSCSHRTPVKEQGEAEGFHLEMWEAEETAERNERRAARSESRSEVKERGERRRKMVRMNGR